MSFIDDHLGKSEHVILRARIHWSLFMTGVILMAAGIVLSTTETGRALWSWTMEAGFSTFMENIGTIIRSYWSVILGWVLIVTGISTLLRMIWRVMRMEMAVTTHRVFKKVGIFTIDSSAMNLDTIESVSLEQSLIGRLMDYGVLTFNSVGDDYMIFPYVSKPRLVRKAALDAAEKYMETVTGGGPKPDAGLKNPY